MSAPELQIQVVADPDRQDVDWALAYKVRKKNPTPVPSDSCTVTDNTWSRGLTGMLFGFTILCVAWLIAFVSSGQMTEAAASGTLAGVFALVLCLLVDNAERRDEIPGQFHKLLSQIQSQPGDTTNFEKYVKSYPGSIGNGCMCTDETGAGPTGEKVYTALQAAIAYASPSAVKILLQYRCKFKPSDLAFAAECPLQVGNLANGFKVREHHQSNLLEVFRYLIANAKEKSYINKPSPTSGRTALANACKAVYGDLVRFLLQNGANPNITDEEGYSPISLLLIGAKDSPGAEAEVKVIVKDLIAHGADLGLRIAALRGIATHELGPTVAEYASSQPTIRYVLPLLQGQLDGHAVFLSHYKIEAGSVARLLKTYLRDRHELTKFGDVFLDSDNLETIKGIEQEVRSSRVLLAMLTKNYLERPYCVIELTSAFVTGIPIVPVLVVGTGSDFDYGEHANVSNEIIATVQSLSGHSEEEVKAAVEELRNVVATKLEPNGSDSILDSQVNGLAKKLIRALTV